VHEIPVQYIGEDIQELADRRGMAIQDGIRLHTETEYIVFALGSQPGFPYLGGLDKRLFSPRRPEPRVRVEAGSVVIGGGQTGVISRTSPSGWHIIGRTEVEFFNLKKEQPALLSPGDKVRFVSTGTCQ
jgi:KipI family sensor histidine kinase inhibitor